MAIATSLPAAGELTFAPRYMTGVSDAELDTIVGLLQVWHAKRERNAKRTVYFEGKMPHALANIIPAEAFGRLRATLGWPAKSVTALAQRNLFDGFVAPGAEQDPFDLSALLEQNRFDLELPQAIASAYKHSCSFITTAHGDTKAGEPDVVIMARSAETSAATWDRRRRVVSGFLAITETAKGERGQMVPTAMDVYLPEVFITCRRRPSGSWVAARRSNPLSEVLAEPLTYDPQLDRPFGRSRISRPVMNITDHAVRTILRMEVSAEFYAAPRMYALGVAEDAFAGGKWKAAIDRWFALTKDEDGDVPTVGQFPQMTMQPLADLYRTYASQFAGETGVPISSLGIVQDNPPSAEALYAAERDLIVEARAQNRVLGSALQRVAQRVVGLRDGPDAITDDVRQIRTTWVNPAFTSPVTAADALVKLAQVFPWIGESEVALEYAGFTEAEITRLLADKRRAQGLATIAQMGEPAEDGPTVPVATPAPTTPAAPAAVSPSNGQADAADLKAKEK